MFKQLIQKRKETVQENEQQIQNESVQNQDQQESPQNKVQKKQLKVKLGIQEGFQQNQGINQIQTQGDQEDQSKRAKNNYLYFSPDYFYQNQQTLDKTRRCFTPFSEFAKSSKNFFSQNSSKGFRQNQNSQVFQLKSGQITSKNPHREFQNTSNQFYKSNTQISFGFNTTNHSRSKTESELALQLKHNNQFKNLIDEQFVHEQQRQIQTVQHDIKRNILDEELIKKRLKTKEKKEQQEMKNTLIKSDKILTFINPNIKQHEEFVENDETYKKEMQESIADWNIIPQQLDPQRPTFREGATMLEIKGKLYLYGGVGRSLGEEIFVYDIKYNQWSKHETFGQEKPYSGRYDHSACVYNDNMLIFGGQTSFNYRLKLRECQNDIRILNLKNFEWSLVKTKGFMIEHRRNSMICIVGGVLHIIGGIAGYENYVTSTYTVNLQSGRVKQYSIFDTKGLAYSVAQPVFKKYISKYFHLGKNKLKVKGFKVLEEGIYFFGGKNQKGKIKNKLIVLRLDENYQPLEWISPEVKGTPPSARFHHSMFHYIPQNTLIIYGGRNDITNQVFGDLWFLSLRILEYIQITHINGINDVSRYNFCYAQYETKVYVFGGIHAEKYATYDLFSFELDPKNKLKQTIKQQDNHENEPEIDANSKNIMFNFLAKTLHLNTDNEIFSNSNKISNENSNSLNQAAIQQQKTVYQATVQDLDIPVAIKVIPKKKIIETQTFIDVQREIEIHSKLKHKHIVRMFGAFQDENSLYIVLELIENQSLFQLLQKCDGGMSEGEISKYLIQIVSALQYLSKRNVIHRDLKLENILIDSKGRAKIADFGCAVHCLNNKRKTFCGTIEYLAQEMVEGKEYDQRIDIWCLGIIFYELLYKRSPFGSENYEQTQKNIKNLKFYFLDNVRPVSLEAKQLITQMLSCPEERISINEIITHEFIINYLQKSNFSTSKSVKFEEKTSQQNQETINSN